MPHPESGCKYTPFVSNKTNKKYQNESVLAPTSEIGTRKANNSRLNFYSDQQTSSLTIVNKIDF
jgi:hypothetical protein